MKALKLLRGTHTVIQPNSTGLKQRVKKRYHKGEVIPFDKNSVKERMRYQEVDVSDSHFAVSKDAIEGKKVRRRV